MMDRTTSSLWVMSFNLRFGLADDGPNNWDQRQKAFPALLTTHPCDFYAFQEANDFQIAFLADLLPDYGVIGQRLPAPYFWQSNVIFFHQRWQCERKEHFYLSRTPDVPSRFSRSRWPRQCTLGLFKNRHYELMVINTHFDFAADVQVRSAELITDRIDRHAHQGPAVLMGDFNATPDSACNRVFTSINKSNDTPFVSAFELPYGATHHGFSGKTEGKSIDWILYRGGLAVGSAQVVTRRFAGIFPSDHFPLVAEFYWPKS